MYVRVLCMYVCMSVCMSACMCVQARNTYLADLGKFRNHGFQELLEAKRGCEEQITFAKVTKTETLLSRCFAKPGWKKDKIAKTLEKYIREFHADHKSSLEMGADLSSLCFPDLWEIVQAAIAEGQIKAAA